MSTECPHSGHAGQIWTWANQYREWGYQPLPSRDKRPLVRFGEHWEKPFDHDVFARFNYGCPAIQVMTGRHWGLMVIDLDGEEAIEKWRQMSCMKRIPKTWAVRTGSGGRHLWFSVPKQEPTIASGVIWSVWDTAGSCWKRHVAIERLGCRKLVMAPPSLHPRTDQLYVWVHGCSPYAMARPAVAPDWLVNRPLAVKPAPTRFASISHEPIRARNTGARADEVLASIGDKVAVAESWGLRIASRVPNAAGWISCHVADREDRNPSASFSPSTGRYWDTETGPKGISLFGLGHRIGLFASPADCLNHLATLYLPRRHES